MKNHFSHFMTFRNRLKKWIFRSTTVAKQCSFEFKMGNAIKTLIFVRDLTELTLCKCAGISTAVRVEL